MKAVLAFSFLLFLSQVVSARILRVSCSSDGGFFWRIDTEISPDYYQTSLQGKKSWSNLQIWVTSSGPIYNPATGDFALSYGYKEHPNGRTVISQVEFNLHRCEGSNHSGSGMDYSTVWGTQRLNCQCHLN